MSRASTTVSVELFSLDPTYYIWKLLDNPKRLM